MPGLVLIPVLCSLLTSGCGSANEAELARLRQENQELRAANEELEKLRKENREIQQLRKDNQEIHKLRADYQRFQQLQRDFQKLQSQSQQLSNSVQQQQQITRRNAELQTQNQQLQGAIVQNQSAAIANACINNLRIIEAGKEQWALENKKVKGAVPPTDGLKAYFKDNQVPACPAGGTYSINGVGISATCSLTGHRLN